MIEKFPVTVRNELNAGTLVAAFQAPGVIGSVLGLAGPVSVYCHCVIVSLICSFYLGVAARATAKAGSFLRNASMLLGRETTIQLSICICSAVSFLLLHSGVHHLE